MSPYGYLDSDLRLEEEEQQLGTLNKAVTYTYETGAAGSVLGRASGYTFPGGSAGWQYDSAGRLSSVTSGADTFTYGYRYTVVSRRASAVGKASVDAPFMSGSRHVTHT